MRVTLPASTSTAGQKPTQVWVANKPAFLLIQVVTVGGSAQFSKKRTQLERGDPAVLPVGGFNLTDVSTTPPYRINSFVGILWGKAGVTAVELEVQDMGDQDGDGLPFTPAGKT